MRNRRRGVEGIARLTKQEASVIPGVRQWLASSAGKKSKRKTLGWDVVGGFLWKWVNDPDSAHRLPDPRLELPLPSEDDMRNLGRTWELLVEVVKQRDGKYQWQWEMIAKVLEPLAAIQPETADAVIDAAAE